MLIKLAFLGEILINLCNFACKKKRDAFIYKYFRSIILDKYET